SCHNSKLRIVSAVYTSYLEEEEAWALLVRDNGLFHIEGNPAETFTMDNLQVLSLCRRRHLGQQLTKMLRGCTDSS
ncbi:hypothetical protein PENTCL1PPCAC_8853, partial [Pristionchus entomophagus]